MARKKINIELPELDPGAENQIGVAEVVGKEAKPKPNRTLDNLPAYCGKSLDGATQADMDEWQRTQPELNIADLRSIYLIDGNISLDKIADRINSISATLGNAKYANFVLAVASIGRGANHADINDLRLRFYTYLELTQRTNMKISNMTAYLSIGMTQSKAAYLAQNGSDEIKDLLMEIQAVCAAYRESITADGKLNPVTSIFWQKNYDGLSDKQERLVTVQDPLGDLKSTDEIKKKYEAIIVD